MRLSENFTLQELIKSSIAVRNGIDNYPEDPIVIKRLEALAQNILQKVRDELGPTVVNSGFRCFDLECTLYRKKVNRLLDKYGKQAVYDWFEKKSHPRGEAADIEVIGLDNLELFNWIRDNLEYDQLFLEFYDPSNPSSGWVHVSWNYDGENRMQSGYIN